MAPPPWTPSGSRGDKGATPQSNAGPSAKRPKSVVTPSSAGSTQGKITRFFASPAPATPEPTAALPREASTPPPPWGALVMPAERARWLRAERVGVRPDRRARPFTAQYVPTFGGWSAPGKGQFCARRDARTSEAFGGAGALSSSAPSEDTAVLLAEAFDAADSAGLALDALERAALARLACHGGRWHVIRGSAASAADGEIHARLTARGVLIGPSALCARGALLAEAEELTAPLTARQLGQVCAALGCAPPHGTSLARARCELALAEWADEAARGSTRAAGAAAARLAAAATAALGAVGGGALARPSDAALDVTWRAQAAIFFNSGHQPSEAAAMLRADLRGLRFAGAAAPFGDAQPLPRAAARTPSTRWRALIALAATQETAVRAGQAAAAHESTHAAASVYLELEAEAHADLVAPTAAPAAADEPGALHAPRAPRKSSPPSPSSSLPCAVASASTAATALPRTNVGADGPDLEAAPAEGAEAAATVPEASAAAAAAAPAAAAEPSAAAAADDAAADNAALRRMEDALLALRIVLDGVGLLEREGEYDLALHYLRLLLPTAAASGLRGASQLGRAHVRIATNLQHLRRPREALEAAERALRCAEVAGAHRLALEAAVLRLSVPPHRWRAPALPARASARLETLRLAAPHAGGVERGALCALLAERDAADAADASTGAGGGWVGLHAENALLQTACALLLWGVFFPPSAAGEGGALADAPPDLERPSFARRRAAALRAAIEAVRRGEWRRLLAEGWAQHGVAGAVSRCAVGAAALGEHGVGLAALEDICAGLGAVALCAVCERLGGDWHTWKHGLPDLLLYRRRPTTTGADAGWVPCTHLVEVKGPGDSLSAAQSAWIDALVSAGADVRVVHVVYNVGTAGLAGLSTETQTV